MRVLFGVAIVSVSPVLHWMLGLAVAACFGLLGLLTRALAPSGAFATVVIGSLAYGFGNLPLAAALVAFFISGSLLSRLSEVRLARVVRPTQGSSRDAMQVLANGGVAVACAAASAFAHAHAVRASSALFAAAIGAVAAAAGDTWSTELGGLSGRTPRSLLSWQLVAAGRSGGVTLPGIVAAPAGGAAIGFAAALGDEKRLLAWVAIGAACGLIGSLFDSLLGATLQAVWYCETCEKESEQRVHDCGCAPGRLVQGWPLLDNNGVNAAATLVGACSAYALARGLLT